MYQVLYRKYRPRVFSDVYGQDHVTSTLKKEISSGRIAHAYLFTGSRGTGKTTCAKILAKAVNCEHSTDGEPCNACEVCRGLDNGSIYDVVEIDAASNNGVDNIRDLREDANYTPTRGRYRVYIIDEVHMLSTGAFNALLKTLEEPPAHVIFILATTEVHKLPATILSRCQRFDFRRIQPETMAIRLNEVAKNEGLTLDKDAAILIARIADGALRDGLSILDQCAGRNAHITTDLVSDVAGLAGRESLYRLSDCISASDSAGAMRIISELYSNSYDMERLCVEMINHFRNFLVVKTVKNSRELIICTDDEYNSIRDSAKKYTLEDVIYALDLFQNTLVTIKGGATARIETELAFVKLCEPKLEQSMDSILSRLSKVESGLKSGMLTVKTPERVPVDNVENTKADNKIVGEDKRTPAEELQDSVRTPPPQRDDVTNPPPRTEEKQVQNTITPEPQAQPLAATNETVEFMQWGDFMDVIHRDDIALFGILSGSKGYTRGEFFLIDSANETIRDFIKTPTHSKAIKLALLEVTGKQYKLGLFKRNTQKAQKRDPLEDFIKRAQNAIDIDLK